MQDNNLFYTAIIAAIFCIGLALEGMYRGSVLVRGFRRVKQDEDNFGYSSTIIMYFFFAFVLFVLAFLQF